MSNVISKVLDFPYRVAAAATMAMTVAPAANATGVGQLATNVKSQLDSVGQLFVGGAFLAGIGLSGAGLLKLKQAADTGGQQVKYGEGLWRLGVGAGLTALPAVVDTGNGTIFNGGQNTSTSANTSGLQIN